jgi:hypothetical protein
VRVAKSAAESMPASAGKAADAFKMEYYHRTNSFKQFFS